MSHASLAAASLALAASNDDLSFSSLTFKEVVSRVLYFLFKLSLSSLIDLAYTSASSF